MVNVLWGTANAVISYFLVCDVGVFHVRSIPDMLVSGAGVLVMAIMLAHGFGSRNKLPTAEASGSQSERGTVSPVR